MTLPVAISSPFSLVLGYFGLSSGVGFFLLTLPLSQAGELEQRPWVFDDQFGVF